MFRKKTKKQDLSNLTYGIDYIKDKAVYPTESEINQFITDIGKFKSVPDLWACYWKPVTGKLSIAKFNTVKGVMLTKPTSISDNPKGENELQFHIRNNATKVYSREEFKTIISNLIYHGQNTRLMMVSLANQGKVKTARLTAQIINQIIFPDELSWSILGSLYETLLKDAKYELLLLLIKNTDYKNVVGIARAIQTSNLDFVAFASKDTDDADLCKKLLVFLKVFVYNEDKNVGYFNTAFYISILKRFDTIIPNNAELIEIKNKLREHTFFVTDETVRLFEKNYNLIEITTMIADAHKDWLKLMNIHKLTVINVFL